MFFNGFYGIGRASRCEPAGRRGERGYTNPVKVDGQQKQERKCFPYHSPYQLPSTGQPIKKRPGIMSIHEEIFSEMRASAIFIFSSSSEVAISPSER